MHSDLFHYFSRVVAPHNTTLFAYIEFANPPNESNQYGYSPALNHNGFRLASDSMLRFDLWPSVPFFWALFWFVFAFRYVRFIVHVARWVAARETPLQQRSQLTSRHISVIIPTLGKGGLDPVRATIKRCLAERPLEILVETIHESHQAMVDIVDELLETTGNNSDHRDTNVKVSSIPRPNKRHQVAHAIRHLDPSSSLIMLVDDDVQWSSEGQPGEFMMHWLAPLSNPKVGAVGSLQRIKRQSGLSPSARIFQVLADSYLRRRNFEITATTSIDGSTSCLSGRTGLIRKEILQNEEFLHGYETEEWMGRSLNADDDNFVTRWLDNHGWHIRIQTARKAYCETYLELNNHFITKQCVRWARSNFRSNWTSFRTAHFWLSHPWGMYSLILQTPFCSLVTDPTLLRTLHRATSTYSTLLRIKMFSCMIVWMVIAKLTKLIPQYWEYPSDLWTIPVTLVFGYLHGFIKYYALFTLHVTGWGTAAVDGPGLAEVVPPETDMDEKIREVGTCNHAARTSSAGVALQNLVEI